MYSHPTLNTYKYNVSMDIYIAIYCTSLCKNMGNLPSLCGRISKHIYPLELPKMAPFCMKITNIFWRRTLRPPPRFARLARYVDYRELWNIKRNFYSDVYTVLKSELTIWTICAFRVLNPRQ